MPSAIEEDLRYLTLQVTVGRRSVGWEVSRTAGAGRQGPAISKPVEMSEELVIAGAGAGHTPEVRGQPHPGVRVEVVVLIRGQEEAGDMERRPLEVAVQWL